MGVATAPEIRYDERIHEEVSYGKYLSQVSEGVSIEEAVALKVLLPF